MPAVLAALAIAVALLMGCHAVPTGAAGAGAGGEPGRVPTSVAGLPAAVEEREDERAAQDPCAHWAPTCRAARQEARRKRAQPPAADGDGSAAARPADGAGARPTGVYGPRARLRAAAPAQLQVFRC